jgi:peptidoglycan/LPS O-acetylase OafA/YrhL
MSNEVSAPVRGAANFSLRRLFQALFQKTVIPSTSIKSRIGGLDELRGVASLWVMICHGTGTTTWMPKVFGGYGYHGVVLFFIVSGYLITKILQDMTDRAEPLQNFYIRRFLRIWPLMIVAIIAGALWRSQYSENAIFNFLFVNNYAMAVGMEPVFRTDVMWSLAIEEQFYLFWPLIAFLLPRRYQPYFLGLIVFLGFCFSAYAIPGGRMGMHKATHGAMQYIALGCLVAYGRKGLVVALVSGALSVAAMLLWGRTPVQNMPPVFWYGITWALFAWVYLTIHFKPLLNSGFLAHMGRLCYGMYIIHFFVSALTLEYLGRTAVATPVAYALVTYMLALVSFYCIEMPAIRCRGYIERTPRAQIGLLLAIVATILVCVVLALMRIGALEAA